MRTLIEQPDQQLLAQQQVMWDEILLLSNSITIKAMDNDWKDVLMLADDRDARVVAFFEQEVCISLFKQVMQDLDAIKQQHKTIMQALASSQQLNSQDEQTLLAAKQALSDEINGTDT